MNLQEILNSGKDEALAHTLEDVEEDSTVLDVEAGYCCECGDQKADLHCASCEEDFCEVCSTVIHRTGKRKLHALKPLHDSNGEGRDVEMSVEPEERPADPDNDVEKECEDDEFKLFSVKNVDAEQVAIIKERAKHIPLRLTSEERKLHRLLEAALNVSEYTDKIDVVSYVSKARRIVAQLKEICAILSGLMVAQDFKAGQALIDDRDYAANAKFYQTLFEIGRRYKIQNPDRMRATYGKMMYMIQDSLIPEVTEALGFDLYRPILTVHSFLESRRGLDVLDDELLLAATKEIIPDNKTRTMIQSEIKTKERSIELLCRKYTTKDLPKEDIRQSLYSIGDNNAYLRSNRDPVQNIRNLLLTHFSPDSAEPHSLAIQAGLKGSRLTHSHTKQFQYVNQSLTLWTLIMTNIYELYTLVDNDLLSRTNRYRLMDTGQGLNRIQQCPAISRKMHVLLSQAQKKCGGWVGSSAIHLGDHNVPNALMFIDKYLQVPRILNPINTVIKEIPSLSRDPFVAKYLEEAFGGEEELKAEFLGDFFRSGFDGSGADNSFDAGSCIDGRLTSAWQWTNIIQKRPYFKALLLSNFQGFDGEGFI